MYANKRLHKMTKAAVEEKKPKTPYKWAILVVGALGMVGMFTVGYFANPDVISASLAWTLFSLSFAALLGSILTVAVLRKVNPKYQTLPNLWSYLIWLLGFGPLMVLTLIRAYN